MRILISPTTLLCLETNYNCYFYADWAMPANACYIDSARNDTRQKRTVVVQASLNWLHGETSGRKQHRHCTFSYLRNLNIMIR